MRQHHSAQTNTSAPNAAKWQANNRRGLGALTEDNDNHITPSQANLKVSSGVAEVSLGVCITCRQGSLVLCSLLLCFEAARDGPIV